MDASGVLFQSSAAVNTPSIASSATALAANPTRTQWSIQNLGQNVLFVRLGAAASSTVFHVALKAGTANDDGTGGICGQDTNVIYTGVISIAGTSPRYTVTEMSS